MKTVWLLSLFPFVACDCGGDGGLHQRKADIEASPNPLVFDAIPNATVSKTLHIANLGDYRLEISNMRIESGDGFSIASETTSFMLEPTESTDVEVRFTATDDVDLEGTLLIESNSFEEEQTRVRLIANRREGPVLVVCVASIDIPLAETCGSPSNIDFGRVNLGQQREATITLRSAGTDPVVVSSVALTGHPSLEIEEPSMPATLAVGESIVVPLHFIASVSESVDGIVSIQSNDATQPYAEVTIHGQGAELGLCIEPASLDFGHVRLGSSKDLELRVYNCGAAALEITGAEVFVGGPEFSLVAGLNGPVTLPVDGGLSLMLTVRYTPTIERTDMGRLRIETPEGTAQVSLTGDGSYSCRLVVTPPSLTFMYSQTTGSAPPKNYIVENVGAEDCTVTRMEIIEGAEDGFAFSINPFGHQTTYASVPRTLASGESMTVEMLFAPYGSFSHSVATGLLEIEAAERPGENVLVDLIAEIDFMSECTGLTVAPDALSFGLIQLGQVRVQAVVLHTDPDSFEPCGLDSIAIVDDGGGVYSFRDPNPPDVVFPQANVFVLYSPNTSGVHLGLLEIVTRGGAQTFQVPLTGGAGNSQICVAPRELAFGDRTTAGTLDFNISACGTDPVIVNSLDWITPDPEFSVINPPTLPLSLAVSETRTITVQYDPQDAGGDTAIIEVDSSDALFPQIPVRMTGGHEVVPPTAGRYLYYWQILDGGANGSDIMRQPLQGNLTPEPFWGPRAGTECAGCHQVAPDGKYVAVTNVEDAGTRYIKFIDSETRAIVPQIGQDNIDGLFMSWNPDVNTNPPYQYIYSQSGQLIIGSLFTGYIGPLMGVTGTGHFDTMPSWGPDGRIAFVRADTGMGGGIGLSGPVSIYVVDEAGGTPEPLIGASNDTTANYYPRYSPNGVWIAFTKSLMAQTTVSALDAQIQLVKADNSGTLLTLPNLNASGSSFPTWSADGQFLSFSSNRPGGAGGWDLYVAPIDQVTGQEGTPTPITEANTEWFEHNAQWGP